jgi:hypothetical protein
MAYVAVHVQFEFSLSNGLLDSLAVGRVARRTGTPSTAFDLEILNQLINQSIKQINPRTRFFRLHFHLHDTHDRKLLS